MEIINLNKKLIEEIDKRLDEEWLIKEGIYWYEG
jgi:RNA-binding protein YhbY